MSVLSDLISKYTDLSNPTAIYEDLTVKNNKVIVYSGLQTIAAIERTYGDTFAITLIATLKAIIAALNAQGPEQQALADYLSIYFKRVSEGDGLDFSDDNVQSRLDSLIPYLTQDVVDKLKAMGAIYKSKWEIQSLDPEPTLEDVQNACTAEIERRHVIDWVMYVKNGILSNNGKGKSITELKILIAERE